MPDHIQQKLCNHSVASIDVWMYPKIKAITHLLPEVLAICFKPFFFLRYCSLKNPAIWLNESFLDYNFQNNNFDRYGVYAREPISIGSSILDYFQGKLMTKDFEKWKKRRFWAILYPFCPNMASQFFSKNQAQSVFRYEKNLNVTTLRKQVSNVCTYIRTYEWIKVRTSLYVSHYA